MPESIAASCIQCFMLTWSNVLPESRCRMKARSTIGRTESQAVCMQHTRLHVRYNQNAIHTCCIFCRRTSTSAGPKGLAVNGKSLPACHNKKCAASLSGSCRTGCSYSMHSCKCFCVPSRRVETGSAQVHTLSNSTTQVKALTASVGAKASLNAAVTLSKDRSLPEFNTENSREASS